MFIFLYSLFFYHLSVFLFAYLWVLQDMFLDKGGSSIKGTLGASLLLHIYFIVAPDISLLLLFT